MIVVFQSCSKTLSRFDVLTLVECDRSNVEDNISGIKTKRKVVILYSVRSLDDEII
jgi:hypothetical protein